MALQIDTENARIYELADQIIQVRLPLPFALNHVNCYLLKDNDGWTILDTGLHWPAAEAGWHEAFHALQITPPQIHRIILTHMHPDHFGMAGYLQQWTGAPILVGAIEHAAIERIWVKDSWHEAAATDFWLAAGLDAPLLQSVTEQATALRQRTMPHPHDFVILDKQQPLTMGGRQFQPLMAPGHSDGQFIFYCAEDQLLLCGDQVLERITPNIGLWPGGAPKPLQSYLTSLAQLEQLAVTLALPGHYTPLTMWQERIATLQYHHEIRLAAMRDAVVAINREQSGKQACTALAIAQRIFNFERFSEHEVRFAVAETLAHLVHLVDQDKLTVTDHNGVHRYRTC